jgi:glucokinase
MREIAVGVDIGGTKIHFALVERDGRIVEQEIVPTVAERGGAAVMNDVLAGITRMLERRKALTGYGEVSGIGIGSSGQIDFATGTVVYAVDTLPGWTGTPIRQRVAERFPHPVYVDNDVNVIAVSEKRYGAGRQYRHFVCLALGTGVGGAVVADGRIIRGASGAAGELGHVSVDFNGPRCSCGNYGCIEQYASGTGIARLARESIAAGGLRLEGEPTAKAVIAAWQKGDPGAALVMDTVIRALGTAVSGFIHTFNPEAVVIGGGVSAAGAAFFSALEAEAEKRTSAFMWRATRILPALVGASSGVIGAAAQVWEYER